MDNFFELTKQLLENYGSAAVFLLGVLEEVLFFIPSSAVFLAVGFLLINPQISFGMALGEVFLKMAVWGALGITLGSFFVYGLFYWGGKEFLLRYGRYFGLSWLEVDKIEKKFQKNNADAWLIFLLRSMPIWSITVVSIFSGIVRVNWKKFGLLTFLGAMVRLMILGVAGWGLNGAYEKFNATLNTAERVGTITLILLIIGGFWWWHKKFWLKRKIGSSEGVSEGGL